MLKQPLTEWGSSISEPVIISEQTCYNSVAIHPEVCPLRIQRHQTVSCDLPLAPPNHVYFSVQLFIDLPLGYRQQPHPVHAQGDLGVAD